MIKAHEEIRKAQLEARIAAEAAARNGHGKPRRKGEALGMAVTAQRLTVSTTAVALNTDVDVIGGIKLLIKNTSANAGDLGPAGVTAGTGYDLAAGASVVVELGSGEQLFAIRSGAADAVLAVLRIGV